MINIQRIRCERRVNNKTSLRPNQAFFKAKTPILSSQQSGCGCLGCGGVEDKNET